MIGEESVCPHYCLLKGMTGATFELVGGRSGNYIKSQWSWDETLVVVDIIGINEVKNKIFPIHYKDGTVLRGVGYPKREVPPPKPTTPPPRPTIDSDELFTRKI